MAASGGTLRSSIAEGRLEKPDRLLSQEELHREVKKERQAREKRLEQEAKEHLKSRWLLPPKETPESPSTTVNPPAAEEQAAPQSALQEDKPRNERDISPTREETDRVAKESSLLREKRLSREAKEHLKPNWMFPEKHQNDQPEASGKTVRSDEPAKEPLFVLPAEPIHNCEFADGDYYCPHGCGAITDDPWEAMFHEVAHFEPEEAAAMREQHQREVAEKERQQREIAKAVDRQRSQKQQEDEQFRQQIHEALQEGKRMRDATSQSPSTQVDPAPTKAALNNNQKAVVAFAVLIVALTAIFPPYRFVLRGPYGISGSREVGHFFSPPHYEDFHNSTDDFYHYDARWISVEVDASRMVLAWAAILIVSAGMLLLFRNKKNS